MESNDQSRRRPSNEGDYGRSQSASADQRERRPQALEEDPAFRILAEDFERHAQRILIESALRGNPKVTVTPGPASSSSMDSDHPPNQINRFELKPRLGKYSLQLETDDGAHEMIITHAMLILLIRDATNSLNRR